MRYIESSHIYVIIQHFGDNYSLKCGAPAAAGVSLGEEIVQSLTPDKAPDSVWGYLCLCWLLGWWRLEQPRIRLPGPKWGIGYSGRSPFLTAGWQSYLAPPAAHQSPCNSEAKHQAVQPHSAYTLDAVNVLYGTFLTPNPGIAAQHLCCVSRMCHKAH